MTETLPPPTEEVRRVVQIVGAEAALTLIETYGGTRLYVPKQPTKGLIELIDEGCAKALSEAWGGDTIKMPLGRAWRVLVYQARGMSYPAIARKAGCSEDTVWRVLSRHERTAKQFDLFQAR
jgi:hypothetical protein